MEITVETNLAEFEGWIDKTVLKQMRFATSVTLYETAKQAQEAVRATPQERAGLLQNTPRPLLAAGYFRLRLTNWNSN